MTTAPPPPPGPPPPPPGAPPPPPPADRIVYRYDATPPGQLPRAHFTSRALAFAIDAAVVMALPIAAVLALQVGPTQVRTCEITEDGRLALFEEGAITGLCEVPTNGTFVLAGLLASLAVALWFGYVAAEGRSGQSLGKRLFGIRTVDARTGEPIGAGRNIGRNLVRAMLVPFVVPTVLDHLWPMWDRDGQTLHDKATSAAVVPA